MRSSRFASTFGRHACLLAALAVFSAAATADDAARKALQDQLNAELMAQSFDAGDIEKAKKYAEDALSKGIKPVASPPSYWSPGWSCSNLTTYRYYSYRDYRNCVYYRRYYGRYW